MYRIKERCDLITRGARVTLARYPKLLARSDPIRPSDRCVEDQTRVYCSLELSRPTHLPRSSGQVTTLYELSL